MKITWLLQGGFIFEISSQRIVVDAYLSDSVEVRQKLTRLAEPPVSLEQLQPDYWICTHNHPDHLDPPTVKKAAAMYPECRFIGPVSVGRHLRELGVDDGRIFQLAKGTLTEHYGLFAENTAGPNIFVEACQKSGISSFAMEPGREYVV